MTTSARFVGRPSGRAVGFPTDRDGQRTERTRPPSTRMVVPVM